MRAWRLAPALYPPLTGEGARLAGGRWNSPGTPLVYASEHLSLAVLEMLVHLEPRRLPSNLVAWTLELPDGASEILDVAQLDPGWRADEFFRPTREIGDQWVRERRSLALLVPSAIIPAERNVLVNPQHPDLGRLQIVAEEPFGFDPRLLRT